MDWVPFIFISFKVLVLGTGMFFAIKWHYEQGKKKKKEGDNQAAVLRVGGKAAAIFSLLLLGLLLFTFGLASMLGLNLTFP